MAFVTAHSMVTSLGRNAATACAAARAGLSRASEIEGLQLTSEVTGAPEPVIAHAVPLLTRGFEGQVRLQRLLFGGLSELKGRLPARALSARGIGFYLAVPAPSRCLCALDLIPDDDTRAVMAERAASSSLDGVDTEFARELLERAARQAGWSGEIDLRQTSLAGHAGGAQCLAWAERDLDSGRVALAIVGAVDSLVDLETIAWLHRTHRLKLSGMPVGLMPGEACVFLALSCVDDGAEGSISRVGLALEPKTLWSGATSVGEGLAAALEQAVADGESRRGGPAWIISDLNGEIYRASEWGHTLVRLRAEWPALENPITWAPAASFGDTGCASSLLSVCTALHAFGRGYGPASSAWIISTSDAELRSTVVVAPSPSLSEPRRH